MNTATILHNPVAGEEGRSPEKLIDLLSGGEYVYHYSEVNESGMDDVSDDTDFLIIAGGDGTVRKVAKQLLLRDKSARNLPIGLLPWGTANNIARALGLKMTDEEIVSSWNRKNIRSIDIWNIKSLPGARFFIEGFGFGVFPQLIKEMGKMQSLSEETTEKRIMIAWKTLHSIIEAYQAVSCRITADGKDYSGKYIMAELMNISSIGPNLEIAGGTDPGDGLIEIVLVTEEQKEELALYIKNKLMGVEVPFSIRSVRAHSVEIECETDLVHVDDELLILKDAKDIEVYLDSRSLRFLVP